MAQGTETAGLRRAIRLPVLAVVVAALAVAAAAVLDTGSARQRDYALVIGAPALYVVLPLAVLWLLTAIFVHVRRRGDPRAGPRRRRPRRPSS